MARRARRGFRAFPLAFAMILRRGGTPPPYPASRFPLPFTLPLQRKADKIGVGVGIGIAVEKEIGMAFGHEKLDVHRAAIEYVGWAMLTKLGQRGYAVCEEPGEYRTPPASSPCCTDYWLAGNPYATP
jgi:hypothetical protein